MLGLCCLYELHHFICVEVQSSVTPVDFTYAVRG